jgi:hypothetical protein
MNGTAWPLVEIASKLLQRDERDAVLGDLLEANETALEALLDVCGLVLRRQTGLFRDRRPWLAGFGVALPCGYLLMYVSISVSCTYARLMYPNARILLCRPQGHEGFLLLLCHIFLLVAWSWTGGYVLGSVSRLTLWASATLSVLPAFLCIRHFPAGSARACLFLFLLPAMLGGRHALRNVRVTVGLSSVVAISVTVLMIFAWTSNALWIFNWVLMCPPWYLVAMARRSGHAGRMGSWPLGRATYSRAS